MPVTAGAEVVGNGIVATMNEGRVVLCGLVPWDFEDAFHVRMTWRRTSFILSRLLANMHVRAETPLLDRFATPVEGDDPALSVVRNADFGGGEDGDDAADHWSVSTGTEGAVHAREQIAGEGKGWAQRLTLPSLGEDGKGSIMLAQHDLPVTEGQWYRISLRARAEGLRGAPVNLTITNTETWRPFFDYQHFSPGEDWRTFSFIVQSKGSAQENTRLQIWYSSVGTVWVTDVRCIPSAPPMEGRWSTGLYVDQPVDMDDPYRFFRW